jgi:hypothetical protein
LKDIVGNEIKPGVRIAYPGRFSSSLYVHVMTVTDVSEDCVKGTIRTKKYRFSEDDGPYRCTVTEVDKKVSIGPSGIKRAVVIQDPNSVSLTAASMVAK